MKFLVYGRGWISQLFSSYCDGHTIIYGNRVGEDMGYDDLVRDIDAINPDRVICLIGRTHGPGSATIDYLEQEGKLKENVRDNLYAPFLLAQACRQLGIHMTYMGTGCIFTYSDKKSKFSESDRPNFYGSSYSTIKGYTDQMMSTFPDVLNLRIRMPIHSVSHPRNFITKITTYERICSVPNSMSVLDSLLPLMVKLVVTKHVGTLNFTNPGIISHNTILMMYRDIVDPSFTWKNFSEEEQRKILSSDRSNNELDTSRLRHIFPRIPSIHDAVEECLKKWK